MGPGVTARRRGPFRLAGVGRDMGYRLTPIERKGKRTQDSEGASGKREEVGARSED
jgi:hypothetical protein